MRRKEERLEKEGKPKKSGSKWRLILAILLFVVGMLLIFSDTIRNFILAHQIASQNQVMQTISAEELAANNEKEATFNFDDINSISIETVLANSFDRSKVPAIGSIAIPSVGINLTVAKGATDLNMLVGAGTLRPDQQMGKGNYTLASHYTTAGNGTLLFTPLLKIQNGDKIYITDLKNVYTYSVYWSEYVEANRVDLVYENTSEAIITLITCSDVSGNGRFAVRGRLESVTPIQEASQEMKKAFQMENRSF